MTKIYEFPPQQRKTVETWLTENVSIEGTRWWTHGLNVTTEGPLVYKVHIDLTKEEESKLTWFILAIK